MNSTHISILRILNFQFSNSIYRYTLAMHCQRNWCSTSYGYLFYITRPLEMWIKSKKQIYNNFKSIPSDICRKDEVVSVTFHPCGWCSEDWKHLIWRVRHVRGNCDHGLWISSRRIWIRWFDQMVQRQSRILSNRATYLHRKG